MNSTLGSGTFPRVMRRASFVLAVAVGLAGWAETEPDGFLPGVVEIPSVGPNTRLLDVDAASRRALLYDDSRRLFEVHLNTGRVINCRIGSDTGPS